MSRFAACLPPCNVGHLHQRGASERPCSGDARHRCDGGPTSRGGMAWLRKLRHASPVDAHRSGRNWMRHVPQTVEMVNDGAAGMRAIVQVACHKALLRRSALSTARANRSACGVKDSVSALRRNQCGNRRRASSFLAIERVVMPLPLSAFQRRPKCANPSRSVSGCGLQSDGRGGKRETAVT